MIQKLQLIFGLFLAANLWSARTHATEVEFSAQPDRTSISEDESVSIKLSIKTDGSLTLGEVKMRTPDFDVVNEYTGTFVESYYENGRFGVRNNQQITEVLRPKHKGELKVDGIQVSVNSKIYTAAPLVIHVGAGGAGTPPPKGYGGGGAGVGLRGADKRVSSLGFFVKAEVDKSRLYKGEQVIVSYYLYRRGRVFNIQVDKYPMLNGFLREDLEMPVLGQRLETEQVMLDGVRYERSLLVRYAAFPVKEGKLNIDTMAIKANYYSGQGQGQGGDEEDPFLNFFQQMAPREGTSSSDVFTIDVTSLPSEGRPAFFSGGVGDFNVTSAVDKYDVHANEAVTLTVKVEGNGNVAAIAEPKVKWPEGLELYESKAHVKSGKGGVGEKIFEYLLIPRAPGKVTLPAMEFGFFDPSKKSYVTRSTQSVEIHVQDPVSGGAVAPPRPIVPIQGSASHSQGATGKSSEIEGLIPPGQIQSTLLTSPVWKALYFACSALLAAFMAYVLYDRRRVLRGSLPDDALIRALSESKSWQRLSSLAQYANESGGGRLTVNELTAAYESLSGAVYDLIDRIYSVGARSHSRAELKQLLVVESDLPEAVWERASRLLEFAETVRYASSTGAVSEEEARTAFAKWVVEGRHLEEAMSRQAKRKV